MATGNELGTCEERRHNNMKWISENLDDLRVTDESADAEMVLHRISTMNIPFDIHREDVIGAVEA